MTEAQNLETVERAFHISLNVRNLGRSVEFYGRLFGLAPAKMYPDYAKFEVADPPLVLSLEPSTSVNPTGGTLNHLGIRVRDQQLIREYYERAASTGAEIQWLSGVECCYSRQSKIVTQDPDGNLVEVYTVDADLDGSHRSAAQSTAPAADQTQTSEGSAWTHLLGTDFPETIPARDHTFTTVHLRGTFNSHDHYEVRHRILAEVKRVLLPGGEVLLHMLVADRTLTKPMPQLPAPAQEVRYVPVQEDIFREIQAAGLVDCHIQRLSHAPVFGFDGVEMRELLVQARTPAIAGGSADKVVVYRGPLQEVVAANGRHFHVGARTAVTTAEWDQIKASPAADQFVFLTNDSKDYCAT